MKKILKQYWFNQAENFGDALAPKITEYVTGLSVEWAAPEDCELFGLGSVLGYALVTGQKRKALGRKACIWGTGLGSPAKITSNIDELNLQVLGLRGRNTSASLNLQQIPIGDPGLLVREIYPEMLQNDRKYQGGLVVHMSHTIHAAGEKHLNNLGWIVIYAKSNDYENIISQISKCKMILSSSLHGLVIADSFCIPNDWINPDDIHQTPRFKFFDYATALNRKFEEPYSFKLDEIYLAIERVKKKSTEYWLSIDHVNEQMKNALGEVFI